MNKKYFECELVVSVETDPYTIKPVKEFAPGPGLDAIRAGDVFAEVNIPMNLPDADYCYVCYLVEVPAWQPAIIEMLTLKAMIADIHARFSKHAAEVDIYSEEAP